MISLVGVTALAMFVAASMSLAFVPTASAANHDVAISNFAFSPNSITIAPGDTVSWTNSDSVTHTVTGNDGSWGSGNLANGLTYSHQFNETGDYSYHCSIHTSMTGVVHVSSDGGTPQQPHSPGMSSSTLAVIIAAIAVVAVVSIVLLWRRMKIKKT